MRNPPGKPNLVLSEKAVNLNKISAYSNPGRWKYRSDEAKIPNWLRPVPGALNGTTWYLYHSTAADYDLYDCPKAIRDVAMLTEKKAQLALALNIEPIGDYYLNVKKAGVK